MRDRDVTELAEQATLGSLLVDPAPLVEIRRWLHSGDFAALWHEWVYTTLLERHTAGEPIDPVAVGAAMVDRFGHRLADQPRLHTLLAATPHTGYAAAYARIVLDGGLRRELGGLGVLLRAGALQTALDGTQAPLIATCNVVDAGLDAAAARWAQATGQPHDDVVVPLALRAAARNTDARESAARYLEANPARDTAAERRHIVELVGTLIAQPDHIGQVRDWLPPSRITDPAWRLIYGTTIELSELGAPIDLVTVAAACIRYAHHGPALPALDTLRAAVEAGWNAYPPQVLRTVAADQIRRLADIGADQLHQAANNPGVQIADIADTGHVITTTLRRTAAALPSSTATTAPVVAPVLHAAGIRR
jgi:replicative DNA helicase